MLEMTRTKRNILLPDENEILERLIDNSKEINNGDITETILEINEILDLLRDDPDRFILKLELMKDDLAEIHNLCNVCGEEKVFVSDMELPEYQSSPVGITRCPNNCEA